MELHLVEHVRRLRGGSQPRLMRASDGNLYVVKLQDNPQGSRVLANELLASRLAQHLGLPVPQAEILELPAKLAESLYFETPTGPKRICPGPQLGLRLVISPINGRIYDFLPQAYANQIRNQEDFAGIHLFDLWTCNRDTRQAVYWKRSQQRKFTVTFVDNGHCFGGPDWKPSADLSANLVPLPCECSCWMAKLDAVAPGLLVRLAAGIPTEWYFNDGRGMCDMIRRLIARRAELRRLLSTSKEPDQEAETILLVEDETALRESLAGYLRTHGHHVIEARDGQDGLEVAKRHAGPIDLLLTDIVMPRMNGNQLAREFVKLHPKAATMYMSGFVEKESLQDGMERTPVFLRKPFRNGVLLAKVHEVLAGRSVW